MEASQRFKNLLHQIENSKLNYVITKTPFSANISVKRSLIKFHDVQVTSLEIIYLNTVVQLFKAPSLPIN